ncbi:MAG TPA: ChaN family lipoprotein [Chitinophagaceae bacterium]|jgi:uncharacterized iron-regulated protein|nr:ChaN family lipoprotein [Chitinophagaceae bacterium]
MKYTFFFIGLLLSSFCFAQTGIEKHYKIYDTRTKQLTTPALVAAGCRDANVIYFGEEHDDSAGHFLEKEIFSELQKLYGDKLALSMEMFETDCQLVVNEWLAGYISDDRFIKESRPWSNYKDYKPVVDIAKQNKLAVVAANTPRRYVNMVSRKGIRSLDSLPKESKRYLPPLPYDTATGSYREKFMDFMKGGSPGTSNNRIFYSQSLWDAGMAYSIYSYWKKNKDKKIFHLVGRFHCDEKLGTATQLQNRKSSLRIMNISCFSDSSFANPDWEKFKQLGDFVIITDPELKKTF